ncbi:MAG: tetratricopeptide repeat protein [Bacteroidales bacterium]|nr:tetratricopeptide repeat protein [Bacteroidales bacterium]
MKSYKSKISLCVLVILVLFSCSTKKNTLVRRSFHELTSYYNYYFNAYESYKRSLRRVDETYKYNYTFPLPVLLLGNSDVNGMVGGDMDRAIKKSTDLITKHSITVKPARKAGATTLKEKEFYSQTEYVKWVREAWLLIGISRTWKGSYDEATQTFEYITLQYPNTTIFFEAQLWLARISIINGDYLNAEDKLKSIESNRKRPKTNEFKYLLSSTWAFFYAKQTKYDEAIPYIKKTLDLSSFKSERLRLTYLLAQLSVKAEKNDDASLYFAKVIKMNPSYEMAFNAKIGLASVIKGAGNERDMKKLLIKLSKDEKNKEYLDQIYYTLGNIEKSEGNIEKAIEYFKLSASKSSGNNHQKGLTYLTLADYYFAKPNYTQSQAYYDSALTSLDNTFPDYQKLETKTHYLTKLVESLNTVNREDSLQRVAKMSITDRNALIAGIINKIRVEEEKKIAQENEDRQRSALYQQNMQYRQNETQSGKWYFYNQAQLSFGQSEFQMKWGKRKLEDNWRRKNKRVTTIEMGTTNQQNTADSSKTPQKVLSNKSIEYYLQDLPTNDSLIRISNERIVDAMFKIGEVYQNDLKDYSETVKAFEKFAQRFPDNPYTLKAYYNLYQVSLFTNNAVNAQKYKDIIVSRFPLSTYALMLTNPNYLKELSEKQNEENKFYQAVYDSYQKGDFLNAIAQADQGLSKYKGSKLESKFNLLKSLSIGKTSDLHSFRTSLNEIVEKYPKTDVSEAATNILEYIRKQELRLASTQTKDTVKNVETVKTEDVKLAVTYKKPKGEHLFIAVVPKKSNLNQLKFNLVSFNVDAFINIDLSVNNQPLNEFFDLIRVEKFKDSKQAMEYYQAIISKEGLFNPLKPDDYSLFIISSENYTLFLMDKSLVDYLKFFNSTYK